MSTPRESEAEEYLYNHKTIELMNNLASMLFFYRPERPRDFLISRLEELKASRALEADSPCLFDDSNLDAVFGILDPTNTGFISQAQYKEAMAMLGAKNFGECPEESGSSTVSRETFKREAKESLLRNAETFQM